MKQQKGSPFPILRDDCVARPADSKEWDWSALRARLARGDGREFWRSLEELAETEEFTRWVEDEFPSRADDWRKGANRREILRLMGAAFAMAGFTACTRQPEERILPYVQQPEQIIPGRPLYFATAMVMRGEAVGLLVESHEGRPTKIEGNPRHPGSLGHTGVWHQAATLSLYDPDRLRSVIYRNRPSSWTSFLSMAANLRAELGDGRGFHVLIGVRNSPTLSAQRQELQALYPAMRWHEYDPLGRDNVLEGARLAFGEPVHTLYRVDQADVILSLDADFLMSMPGNLAYARQFFSRRRGEADRRRMNRLYVVEPTPSVTGAVADHRLPLKASQVETFARQVLALVTGQGSPAAGGWERFAAAVAQDLGAHRGASLVVAGDQQPAAVHALAHRLNAALGNVGKTVIYTDPVEFDARSGREQLGELASALAAGQVQTLLIIGANPVYDAPADWDFSRRILRARRRIFAGLHDDETGQLCEWRLPLAHFLESWSDATAYDGTVSIVQPLIAPLYDSRTVHEILSMFTDRPDRSSYEIVRSFWRQQTGAGEGFESFWSRALHDGLIPDTQLAVRTPLLRASTEVGQTGATAGGLELVFRPDPNVWDGCFANNAWLQETPKPLTKITWDNAIYVSPKTAERLELRNEEVIEVRVGGRSVRGPAWIVPGQADDVLTLSLGYGRRAGGRIGSGIGYNAYLLRTSAAPDFCAGAEIRKIGERYALATTQNHHSMEGRDIVRTGSNEEFLRNPALFRRDKDEHVRRLTFLPEWKNEEHKWGLVIDQNACFGCNACIVACVAENNIPVVGKDQVRRGREMHWIRVDTYYSGGLEQPAIYFQPVPCMQCEQAPCEPVCPVAATVHSSEGLNQMVYNRCVGTRYCSNNCPYKVRRFNFYLYADWNTPELEPLRNPEVTVRSRGVMEKCTYCIQRIERARIDAALEGRPLRDGEVQPACQQACPAEAIVFGDLNDPRSRIAKLKHSPLNYPLLAELGTNPRTTYLARLRNPNPGLGQEAAAGEGRDG